MGLHRAGSNQGLSETGTFPEWIVQSQGVSNKSGNDKRSLTFCVCVCKRQLLKATAMLGDGKVQEKSGKVWNSRNVRFGKGKSS